MEIARSEMAALCIIRLKTLLRLAVRTGFMFGIAAVKVYVVIELLFYITEAQRARRCQMASKKIQVKDCPKCGAPPMVIERGYYLKAKIKCFSPVVKRVLDYYSVECVCGCKTKGHHQTVQKAIEEFNRIPKPGFQNMPSQQQEASCVNG
jgi:hypothetical protein